MHLIPFFSRSLNICFGFFVFFISLLLFVGSQFVNENIQSTHAGRCFFFFIQFWAHVFQREFTLINNAETSLSFLSEIIDSNYEINIYCWYSYILFKFEGGLNPDGYTVRGKSFGIAIINFFGYLWGLLSFIIEFRGNRLVEVGAIYIEMVFFLFCLVNDDVAALKISRRPLLCNSKESLSAFNPYRHTEEQITKIREWIFQIGCRMGALRRKLVSK